MEAFPRGTPLLDSVSGECEIGLRLRRWGEAGCGVAGVLCVVSVCGLGAGIAMVEDDSDVWAGWAELVQGEFTLGYLGTRMRGYYTVAMMLDLGGYSSI